MSDIMDRNPVLFVIKMYCRVIIKIIRKEAWHDAG
jgi:hypothetical protein